MFGYVQFVIDVGVWCGCIGLCCLMDQIGWYFGKFFDFFGCVFWIQYEFCIGQKFVLVVFFVDEGFVIQFFGYDYMCQCCDYGDIGVGLQWQMQVVVYMWCMQQVDFMWVDDDQFCFLLQLFVQL